MGWLDGVRGLSATYVILHHFWLYSWPYFPKNRGPWWLGWLLYGHFGVVVFIVVSGYSLALSPRRHDLHFPDGVRGFAKRRAWRILPPYWASLCLSTLIVITITSPRAGGEVDLRSFWIHAFLLQDIFESTTPNGTFWSIAIEAQIYIVFPLLLLLARSVKAYLTLALTVLIVISGHFLALAQPSPFSHVNNFVPQLLVCFALGMTAAQFDGPMRLGRARLLGMPLVATLATLLALAFWRLGSATVVRQFFWADIAVGVIVALAFRELTVERSWTARALSSRTLQSLGRFSYSSYLVHGPIVLILSLFVMNEMHLSGLGEFALFLGLGLPLCLGISYLFFKIFEAPFLTVRSFGALHQFLLDTFRKLLWPRKRTGSAIAFARLEASQGVSTSPGEVPEQSVPSAQESTLRADK